MKNLIILIFTFIALTTHVQAASVLYIGDSHSAGHFGKRLDSLLRTLEVSVATFAKGGSKVGSWVTGDTTEWGLFKRSPKGQVTYGPKGGKTPMLSYLIEYHKPQKIIVALGTNNVGQTSEAFRDELIQMMDIIRASGAKCLWVTPPASRNILTQIPRMKTILLEIVSNYCTTFQSDYVTTYPVVGGDGLHFANFLGAKAMADFWAERVYKKFKNEI
jgi:lysophospholipase L1-like esterase